MPVHSYFILHTSTLCVFASLLSGCASDGEEGTITGRKITSIAPLDDSIEEMRRGASPGTLSDNGLEVRTWLVGDRVDLIAPAMTDLAAPAPLDERLLRSLEQNGMRLHRIPLRDLAALQEAVGGASYDEQVSFGQVFDWRALFTRSLNGVSRGVAIDGRVRSLAGGEIALLARAWTMKTEDGPRVQFELAPYYIEPHQNLRDILASDTASPFYSGEAEPGDVFRSMVVRTGLEDGYAYVLTCESPAIDWRAVAREDPSAVQPAAPPPPPDTIGDVRGTRGPAESFGPEIAGPSTLGELLMRGEDRGVRLMIILIPHVPAALFPPASRIE